MTTPKDSDMKAIVEKIGAITEQAADDDYIFRGEPECYRKVTSTLYRHYENEIEANSLDIEIVQKAILQEAKRYTDEIDDFKILTELQHYGSKTNLIDFTTDLHIALFFACGRPDKDGRVILLPSKKVILKPTRYPKNRVISQKSIFAQPPEGFIEPKPGEVVSIPKKLKFSMLDYLRKYHGITNETIFNDLQGFIRAQDLYYESYTAFYKGDTFAHQQKYDEAICYYTECIRLRPEISSAPYEHRGDAYHRKGDLAQAIRDYDKVIKLDPTGTAYFKRGVIFLKQKKWKKAKSDFRNARDAGTNVAFTFILRYQGIANFERQHSVEVPEKIRAILRLRQGTSG